MSLNEAEKGRKMKKSLLVCAMLIGMFVFVGCGEQSEKAEQASQASQKGQAGQAGQAKQSSPTQAFNEWRNAIIAGKIDIANGLTGKGEAVMNAMYVEAVKDNVAEGKILKSGTITGEEIKGDKAIIKMKGEGGKTADFVMVNTQGKWKISHEE